MSNFLLTSGPRVEKAGAMIDLDKGSAFSFCQILSFDMNYDKCTFSFFKYVFLFKGEGEMRTLKLSGLIPSKVESHGKAIPWGSSF